MSAAYSYPLTYSYAGSYQASYSPSYPSTPYGYGGSTYPASYAGGGSYGGGGGSYAGGLPAMRPVSYGAGASYAPSGRGIGGAAPGASMGGLPMTAWLAIGGVGVLSLVALTQKH